MLKAVSSIVRNAEKFKVTFKLRVDIDLASHFNSIRLIWVRTKHKCKLINIHNWELAKLERAEALAVLHEILKECKESVTMNGVSLETPSISSLRGYQIKINCTLDIASKQCIEPILNKHKLLLKETEGFVIIQSI